MDINNGPALAKNLLNTAGLKLETAYIDKVGNSFSSRILTAPFGHMLWPLSLWDIPWSFHGMHTSVLLGVCKASLFREGLRAA
ncbi:hypothetical protein VTO73DRAFT_14492 [Trametes versicolor]